MIIINLDLAGNTKGNLYYLHKLIGFILLVWPHDNNYNKPEILLHKWCQERSMDCSYWGSFMSYMFINSPRNEYKQWCL